MDQVNILIAFLSLLSCVGFYFLGRAHNHRIRRQVHVKEHPLRGHVHVSKNWEHRIEVGHGSDKER